MTPRLLASSPNAYGTENVHTRDKIPDGEYGGRVDGEDFMERGDSVGDYGLADKYDASEEKIVAGCRGVAVGGMSVVPTNNEPNKGDDGAKARAAAVAPRPEIQLITTTRAVEDLHRDEARLDAREVAEALAAPAERIAAAFASGHVG